MCGFVGIVNYNKNLKDYVSIIKEMSEKISHRGPDENGFYINEKILFGHRRLVVRDKEGGAQPMSISYKGNTYTICYNGQIYNSEEIRKTLKENGIICNSYSDTEILLRAYIFYGYDVLKHLNGIFSFAIWDLKKEELFIARDEFGVKPFFYTFKNNNLIFASEIKSILCHPEVETIVDENGLCELFGLRSSSYSRSYSL